MNLFLRLSKQIFLFLSLTCFFGNLFPLSSRPGGGGSYRSSGSSYRSSGSSYRSYNSSNSYNSNQSGSKNSYNSDSSKSKIPKKDISYIFSVQKHDVFLDIRKDGTVNVRENYTIVVPDNQYLSFTIPCRDPANSSFELGTSNIRINSTSLLSEEGSCLYDPSQKMGSKYILIDRYNISLQPNTISVVTLEYKIPFSIRLEDEGEILLYEINRSSVKFQSFQFTNLSIKIDSSMVDPKFEFLKEDLITSENNIEVKETKGVYEIPINRFQFEKSLFLKIIFPEGSFLFNDIDFDETDTVRFHDFKTSIHVSQNSILEVEESFALENINNSEGHLSRSIYNILPADILDLDILNITAYSILANPEKYISYTYNTFTESNVSFSVPGSVKNEPFTIKYNYGRNVIQKEGKQYLGFPINAEYQGIREMDFIFKLPESMDPKNVKFILDDFTHRLVTKVETTDREFKINIKRINIDKRRKFTIFLELPSPHLEPPPIYLSAIWILIEKYRYYGNVIVIFPVSLLLIIFGILYFRKKSKENRQKSLEKKQQKEAKLVKIFDNKFSIDGFKEKVNKTYIYLTKAWLSEDMKPARKFVTSGLYNRYRVQLELMKNENIRNTMKNERILDLTLVASEKTNSLETIHVKLKAEARDKNVSRDLTQSEQEDILSSSPIESYVEIWSFLRKPGVSSETGKGLDLGSCPCCGAPAELYSDSVQCPYCKSLYNSGEYDWVLSEITQEVEWNPKSKKIKGLDSIIELSNTISKQSIEDRSSYLFWKWIDSRIKNSYISLRRDATAIFLSAPNSPERFREVAVGSVELETLQTEGDRIIADVLVKWSAGDSKKSEPYYRESTLTLVLDRSTLPIRAFAGHLCSNCGFPLPETDSIQCEACGTDIPEKVKDWLLESIR